MKLTVTFDNDEERKEIYTAFGSALKTEDEALIEAAINTSVERFGLRGLHRPFVRGVNVERPERSTEEINKLREERTKLREERIQQIRDRQEKKRGEK